MGLVDSAKTEEQRNALWGSFTARWPAEKLSELTLEEYTGVGSQDTFTYWLEAKTEDLGSIWGGSAFKFGVFRRKDQKHATNGAGRAYSADYGWYSKYGDSPAAAFERVRGLICATVQAAKAGDLKGIDSIDLGPAIKWKIAFLYQNRSAPVILPVFKRSFMRAFIGKDTPRRPMSDLQAEVMGRLNGGKLFEFAAHVWKEAGVRLDEGSLTADRAFEYLSERFDPQHETVPADAPSGVLQPMKSMSGFVTETGRELAFERNRQSVCLYLEPGRWEREGIKLVQNYSAQDSRDSNVAMYAPKLREGNPACKVEVQTMAALKALCDEYDRVAVARGEPILNQILFGPPGTGKTFHAVTEALRILDPDYLQRHGSDRAALKKKFDELATQKRVRFVTFHQSFSYEDFVEGIRAVPSAENPGIINYTVERGVFAEICESARLQGSWSDSRMRADARVWKLSIGRRKDARIRQECFRRDEARIGWGDVGDLSNETRPKEQLRAFANESETNQHSLSTFFEGVEVGDIVLCLRSRTSVEAVGIVEGDYEFDDTDNDLWGGYFHKRKVRWLAKDLDVDIRSLNEGSELTQKTIYELKRITAADALRLIPKAERGGDGAVPYVLIIDEINRGNISKVFGELITLLEPSKRTGAREALEVTLPYSKRSFSVPSNVHVIGTMNTADRSLASLDIALRRRFIFVEMAPQPDALVGISIEGVDISSMLTVMNQRIEVLLDRDHALGHAYFLALRENPTLDHLAAVFRRQVLPLLQEYFFEDWERIQWVLNDHRKQSEEHRFVVRPAYQIGELIGHGAGIPTEARQWRINEKAFEHPESFLGIIWAE